MLDLLKTSFQEFPSFMKLSLVLILVGSALYVLYHILIRRWLHSLQTRMQRLRIPLDLIRLPLLLLFPPAFFLSGLFLVEVNPAFHVFLEHSMVIWLILGIAWLTIRTLEALKRMIMSQYDLTRSDNLKARQISTQLNVIQRVLVAVIILLAISAVLMTFDRVRQIGFSILASAGIAGIILGFAAQRSLANLIAGIQIAITQPIRIDDVVIVENEWGWIEEITLTYVVIRIWDQRRLIVPITQFIEKPFQNWTRTTAELLGTVYIYADYRLPVEAVRGELNRIVKQTDLWDGRVAKVQVTNTGERTMEIRALVSAGNSSNAWDLRCLVREGLLDFLQREFPQCLPRVRLDSQNRPPAL